MKQVFKFSQEPSSSSSSSSDPTLAFVNRSTVCKGPSRSRALVWKLLHWPWNAWGTMSLYTRVSHESELSGSRPPGQPSFPCSEVTPMEGCWVSEEDSVKATPGVPSLPWGRTESSHCPLEFYSKCRILGLTTAFPENACMSLEKLP